MGIFSSSPSVAPEASARKSETATLSIIAAGTTIVGDVETAGTIKVEGRIRGSVRAAGQILLAQGGMIEGDLYTREAIIGGDVQGTIRVEERVEIQSSAVVHGDIVTTRIHIAEGGQINGTVTMGQAGAAPGGEDRLRLAVSPTIAESI